MRGRLLATELSVALSLFASLASADPSPKSEPRTTDELVQLYVAEVGYAGLTGLMVHDLAGQDSIPSFVLPSVGVAALVIGATVEADRAGTLSLGQPQAIATDTWIGAAIGGAWVWHFDAKSAEGEGWSRGAQSAAIWAGATAGALIGALRYELRPTPTGPSSADRKLRALDGYRPRAFARRARGRAGKASTDAASLGTALGLEVGLIAAFVLTRARASTFSIG